MMRRRSRKQSAFGRLAAMLGVLALALRTVIAPGVMPDPAAAAQGVFTLVICTGDGILVRSDRLDDRHPVPANGSDDHTLCPYASAGHVAMASGAASPPAGPVHGAFAATVPQASVPGIERRRPSARAPPQRA